MNTTVPSVIGTPQRAQTLSASQGTWSGVGNTYAYQWQRDGGSGYTNISGATSTSYTLGVADENSKVRVLVTATNPDGTIGAASAPTATIPTAPPTNSVAPTISGTAQRTYTLSGTQGTWSGIGNTYTYQWQRSSDGSKWNDILAATALTYTLTAADEGNQVRLQATAVNPDDVLSVQSAPSATVAGAPPVNTTLPAVTGTAARASTLTVSQGAWSGLQNSYAYQWQRSSDATSWANILGATTATYKPGLADENNYLRAQVSASNADGTATATATATALIAKAPPVSTTAPAVSGTPARAQTLTATAGTWSGPDNTYAYQWQRSADSRTWTNISGAGALTYTLTAADLGDTVRLQVTATNPDASAGAVAASTPTATVQGSPPLNTVAPAVSGTPQRTFTLTATTGTWTGAGNTFAYQWQSSADGGASWQNITGANSATYVPQQADEGENIRMLLTATNPDLLAGLSVASVATSAIQAAPPQNGTPPSVSGAVRLGAVLTANAGSWTPSSPTIGYQWQRSAAGGAWADVPGAIAQPYTPVAADAGHMLRVKVTASNVDGAQGATSPATQPVAQPPQNLDAPDAPSGTLLDNNTLVADNGSWDTPGATFSYRWERCPASATSITAACTAVGTPAVSYLLQAADVGYRIGVQVTALSSGGASVPAASALTATVAGRPLINTTPPSITGIPQVTQTLHANPGTWNIQSSVTYTWQRCDADGASNCIAVASGPAYVLAVADDARTIVLYATAASPGQTVSAHSPALTIQAQPLPQATVTPNISGTPARGQALTASQGSWANNPTSLATQWQRCNSSGAACQSIAGATGGQYTVTKADEGSTLTVLVTAANTSGTGTAAAQPTGVAAATPPVLIHPPAVTGIAYQQGVTVGIIAGSASWNAPADTTYATSWERCDSAGAHCQTIAGAANTLYIPAAADAGSTLRGVITATNPDAAVAGASAPTPVILAAAPRWKVLPLISTDPGHVGDTLTVTPGVWSGPTVDIDTVQIMSCTSSCAPVGAANASGYLIASTDLGAILRVRETASNSGGPTVVWSAQYVGPVTSAAAGTAVLKPRNSVAVRNTRGQVLATAQLQAPAAARQAHLRAVAAAARPGIRTVAVRRARAVTGRLSAWACPVAVPGSNAPLKCTAKVRLGAAATVTLPAGMTGRVRVVVVRRDASVSK